MEGFSKYLLYTFYIKRFLSINNLSLIYIIFELQCERPKRFFYKHSCIVLSSPGALETFWL